MRKLCKHTWLSTSSQTPCCDPLGVSKDHVYPDGEYELTMANGQRLKVYCDMKNGMLSGPNPERTHRHLIHMDLIAKLSTPAGGWTRVINVLGCTKQTAFAVTGALHVGRTSESLTYKLTDAHINEIATDAGTKDFLLICAGEVEFGKFTSVCSLFGLGISVWIGYSCLVLSLLHSFRSCLPPRIRIIASPMPWFRCVLYAMAWVKYVSRLLRLPCIRSSHTSQRVDVRT